MWCFYSVCPSFCPRGGGGGGSWQMHYLANVLGIEHFLAKKCSYPEGGGESGQMHYLANVLGIEHFLAKKCSYPEGGSGEIHYLANVPQIEHFHKCSCPVISQNATKVPYISIMHCSLPVISLLICCQKELLKACTCLYSQAARHSGILPPPSGNKHYLANVPVLEHFLAKDWMYWRRRVPWRWWSGAVCMMYYCTVAWDVLEETGVTLDAVERGISETCELECCSGSVGACGGRTDESGDISLDAMIMDGYVCL